MILRTISIAFLVVSVMAGVALPQSGPGQQGIISGYITDAAGCPVAGARLTLHPPAPPWDGPVLSETRSDAQGRFEFTPADLADYLVEYEILNDGTYGTAGGRDHVHLRAAGTGIAFQLTPGSPLDEVHLRVVVTDLDDVPIAGARVRWQRLVAGQESMCASGSMVTGTDGRAEQDGISKGLYRLAIDADGFAPSSRDERLRGAFGPYRFQLLTLAEAEKARKATTMRVCCGVATPSTIRDLVSEVDAIVVARVLRAATDPIDSAGAIPDVRTRYQIQPIEIIKRHAQLPTTAASVSILHDAGEVEWQGTIVPGCERPTLKRNDVYVLFLDWNAGAGTFTLAHNNALVANVTSGKVMTLRRSHEIARVIADRQGIAAEAFLNELRSAIGAAR